MIISYYTTQIETDYQSKVHVSPYNFISWYIFFWFSWLQKNAYMCKKKKISLSTNRKYHYRKHKTKTKPFLQDHCVNNSVREETGTFSVYGHSDLHSVTQRNERHSYFQICHDHSYSMQIPKPEAEYDWDHMQTTDLSNESPSFPISQESQDNCYSMNVQVSE